MLPGFGEALTMWKYTVPVLAQNHQVVALDLRGHGRSMKVPGNNRQKRMAEDVKELIDYLALKEVLLVGHSLGGAVAASYAQLFDQYRLRGMILADASLYAFSDEEWNHHKGRGFNIDGWYKRMMPYITDPVQYAEKARKASPLKEEDAELMRESMLQLPPWIGVEYHLDTYFTDNMTPLENRTIPVATFVSHSSYHDAWESGHEAVKRMKKSPFAICYEFTECNHHLFPLLEADKFNQCILDFEKQIDRLSET
ncbi:MAG: alpha/beta fold hydrolase [Lachnospiraceae bacterium]